MRSLDGFDFTSDAACCFFDAMNLMRFVTVFNALKVFRKGNQKQPDRGKENIAIVIIIKVRFHQSEPGYGALV